MNENLYKAGGALVAALVLAGLVNTFLATKAERQAAVEQEASRPENLYESDPYGIAFTVPDGLYLQEKLDAGTPEKPQLSVVLVEDTPENRDALAGKGPEGGEGPPLIAVDAYPNPDGLDPSAWVQQDTNWGVRVGETERAQVAGNEGIAFRWSGLYEGKTVVVTRGGHAYALSVEWRAPDDRLVEAFAQMVNSATLR